MHTPTSILRILQTATLLLCGATLALASELASEPILRIDPGEHTAQLSQIATDKAERYLVTASFDKTARVWNLSDGRLLSTLRIPIGPNHVGTLYAAALSPDGQTVALGGYTSDASILLFDRASGRILRQLNNEFPSITINLAFSPDGRSLAAVFDGQNTRGLRLFSVADGRLLAKDQYEAGGISVQFDTSPAGRKSGRLITASYDGNIRLYNFNDLHLTLLAKRSAPGGAKPNSVRFSPDGTSIAVGFADTHAVNVLKAVDLSFDFAPDTAGIAWLNEASSFGTVAWSKDGANLFAAGTLLALSDDRRPVFFLLHWPEAGHGSASAVPLAGGSIMDLISLSGGRVVFSSADPAWGLVNAQGQRTLFHAPVVADFRANLDGFTLSDDGAQVGFAYEALGKSPVVFDSRLHDFVTKQGLKPPIVTAAGLDVDWKNTRPPKLNGVPLKIDSAEITSGIALLPDGSGFALGSNIFLRLINRDGTKRWERPTPGIRVMAVNVSKDGRWVVAAYGDGTIRWHRASDGLEQLAFFPHADKKRWVLWSPSGYYDASPGAENLIGWHINHFLTGNKVMIKGVTKDSPGMHAGFLAGDIAKEINGVPVIDAAGFINIVSKTPTSGKLNVKVLRNNELRVIEVTPSRDNPENSPRIGLVLNTDSTVIDSDFFPASRFRERFNRPDVLAQILNTQDEAKAVQLANAESGRRTQTVSVAQVLPPVLELLSPTMDSRVQNTKVTLRYKVRTLSDAPVTGIRVRVNGQAVSADRALKRVESGDTREIEVTIPAQDSEISLFAENKNGVSVPASVWVRWAGKKVAEETLFKPKLYVLAVGVSKYKNPDYNLGLAAKDATDFAAVFQKQKGKLYSDVVVKLLTNDGASKDEVLDGLEWLKQQVTARDVGVMFLAGHGMNDNTGSYYFLPYNADPEKLLRTGVAQNDIKVTLNSLAGKAMFFVDSCHSGNALGTSKTRAIGNTTDALVNELSSAENGVVVFSSSTGKQLSQENAAWGNGAFTKAVVEGLSGKADYSKDHSGKITHKGLDLYVTERVKELTKGQQSPVSISPQGVTDFPIAVVSSK